MIEISQSAAKEIKRIQSHSKKPDSQLELKVKPGGCYGLFYCLELDSSPKDNTAYHYFESGGVSIAISRESYSYLQGTKLDYAEDLMGGNFRILNPNVSQTCGCGISFAQDSIQAQ